MKFRPQFEVLETRETPSDLSGPAPVPPGGSPSNPTPPPSQTPPPGGPSNPLPPG